MHNFNFEGHFPYFAAVLTSDDAKIDFIHRLEAIFFDISGLESLYVGAEIEFYIRCTPEKALRLSKNLEHLGVLIKHETGHGQYECSLAVHNNFLEMAYEIIHVRSIIRKVCQKIGIFFTFDGKPFRNEPPSSLQVSISFSKFKKTLTMNDSDLQHAAAGMLENLSSVTYLLMLESESYARFANVHDINKFRNSPINATWGYNNRTVAVRAIAMPSGGDRLEYRLAPANSCPFILSIAILYSIIDGFIADIELPERTFVDALSVKSAKMLPLSKSSAFDAFIASKTALALNAIAR